MAKRESQGLQIALILFVMITVVLAVTTFVFFRQAEQMAKEVAAAEKKAEDAKAFGETQSYWNQYFMHILGAKPLDPAAFEIVLQSVEGDEAMAGVHASFESDVKTFGEGLPEETVNYRDLPPNILQAVRKLNTANTGLLESNNQLIAERDQMRADSLREIDLARTGQKAAEDERSSAQEDFTTRREELKTTQEKQFADYDSKIKEVTTLVAVREKTIQERDSELKAKDNTIVKQKDTITELRDEPFEAPDGRIAWVNQASRTVWVNLGMADGLRRQTTFSVYDHDAMNVAPGAGGKIGNDEEASRRKVDERKGMIEITRVIDQHLAEARIVDDYTADPILPGDQIFSPAWKPGRKVRFALVGFMDIDGDARSDRELVRNIISMGGGIIDAEVHDDGAVEGELSANTRYLVRGTPPDGSDPKVMTAYTNLIGQAEKLGIQEINLLMLLDLMGYKAEVRTIGLGKNADPLQFKAEPEGGRARTSTGSVSDAFEERRPPLRKSSGAAY